MSRDIVLSIKPKYARLIAPEDFMPGLSNMKGCANNLMTEIKGLQEFIPEVMSDIYKGVPTGWGKSKAKIVVESGCGERTCHYDQVKACKFLYCNGTKRVPVCMNRDVKNHELSEVDYEILRNDECIKLYG